MNAEQRRRHEHQQVCEEIVGLLAGMLPEADRSGLAAQVATLGLGASPARCLRDYLSAHPDAVSSGRSDGPPDRLRLLRVLALDHPRVRLACCVSCGQVKTLPYRLGDGRACQRCYAGQHLATCVRCHRVGRPTVPRLAVPCAPAATPPTPAPGNSAQAAGRPGTSPTGSRALRGVSPAARGAPECAVRAVAISRSMPIPSAGRCVAGAITSPALPSAPPAIASCTSGSGTLMPGSRSARPAGVHHRPRAWAVVRSSPAGEV